MIAHKCKNCHKEFFTYPSRIKAGFGRYCSIQCYAPTRAQGIKKRGRRTRFSKGCVPWSKGRGHLLPHGANHSQWKGEQASYRALHYWLRRVKGIPFECV